jgi:anti-sigma regulatory factor (Ser/Thr protein kinase)
MPRLYGYFDFSKIERISASAAVVLAAEYERMSKFLDEVPPTVNLDQWSSAVFRTLFESGFFETLGLSNRSDVLAETSIDELTMKIVTCYNANQLGEVDTALQKLCEFLGYVGDEKGTVPFFLTALSEAITNVTNHAYPKDALYDVKPIDRIWITGSANRVSRQLHVVVFDQGVSIPYTYPKFPRAELVKKFLRRALFAQPETHFRNDGTYIRAAMRYGGTRTGEINRGRGFPQMVALLAHLGDSSMTVHSRGGWCNASSTGKITSGSHELSAGGTLIEWRVRLPHGV